MAKDYDIFNPHISAVPRGMRGKTIIVYGSNSTGKTKQATRAEKPFYLGFESGINAIAGIPFLPLYSKWANFKKLTKQLTNPKTLEKAQEKYMTLIFDTVEASAMMCKKYVADQNGADSIKSGNDGYGLWSEYEEEYWAEINKLTSVGYTVYFISHEGSRDFYDDEGEKYSKIYPKGDKRSIDPVCDLCDIVLYLKPNGLDENGNEIKSSGYMVNTKEFLSRSRFDFMTPYLKEFTIESLEKAIADAIDEEEKVNGEKSVVSFDDYVENNAVKELTFEEIKEEIKRYAMWLHSKERMSDYTDVCEEYLGKGGSVSEATNKQIEQLEMILFDLESEFKDEIPEKEDEE